MVAVRQLDGNVKLSQLVNMTAVGAASGENSCTPVSPGSSPDGAAALKDEVVLPPGQEKISFPFGHYFSNFSYIL